IKMEFVVRVGLHVKVGSGGSFADDLHDVSSRRGQLVKVNPGVLTSRRRRIVRGSIGSLHECVGSVKAKCLSHFARRKGRAALQRAVVAVLNVVGVTGAWIPSDHAGGWRRARRRRKGEKFGPAIAFRATNRCGKDSFYA